MNVKDFVAIDVHTHAWKSALRVDEKGFHTERKVVEEERRLGLNQPYGSVPEKPRAVK